jgi:hypothetical protein
LTTYSSMIYWIRLVMPGLPLVSTGYRAAV